MHNRRSPGFAMTLLYALIGAIVGSLIGQFLQRLWAPLGHNYLDLGIPQSNPWNIDLGVVGVSLGIWLKLNLAGIIGLLAGVVEAQRRR